LAIILGLSLPFSALLFVMLRQAFPLLRGLTAVIGGLAVAAAAATLLNLFHPFDAAVLDLLVHAFAVALVIVISRIAGERMFRQTELVPQA
ncbi:MAG: NrsF family protein, partial [Xanthobacteraceae bacterium]